MHGATAKKKTELAKDIAAYRDELRQITATASATPQTKGALQDEDDSGVTTEQIEKTYGTLMKKLGSIPEVGATRSQILRDKLNLVREDMKTQSKLSTLPGRLEDIDRQIESLKGRKPLDEKGKEADQKWRREVLKPRTDEFAQKCDAATVELTNLAKAKAKELAKTAKDEKKKDLEETAKASELIVIKKPIENLRVRFGYDFVLEGQTREKQLIANYNAELEGMKKELTAFVNGVDFLGAVRAEAKGKAEAAKQAQDQGSLEELEAAKKTAQASLAKLTDLGSLTAAGYAKDIREATLVKQVNGLDAKIRQEIKSMQEAAKATAAQYEKHADNVGKQLEKSMSGQNAGAKAALKALQTELEQTKTLAATGNPYAAAAAARISAKIQAASADAAKKDSAFSKLFARAAELDEVLGDETITKFFAKQKEPLQKALAALTKDADGLNPAESQKTLDTLDGKIVALTNRATALHQWQDLVKKQLGVLQSDMKELMGGGLATLVRADTKMALLIKSIEAAYQTPGVDQKAVDLMIDDLNGRIFKIRGLKAAGKKPEFETAIDGEQKEAKADVEKKEKEEKAKELELKKFHNELSALKKEIDATEKKVIAAKGSEEDIAALRTIVSAADAISKSGELKDAREKLEVARTKRNELEANPGGFAMRSVKELSTTPAQWKKAIADAEGLVKEVAKKAQALAKEDKGVTSKIEGVTKVFNRPALFDAPLAVLVDETANDEDRKAARERILREVRALRASMDANPVLQLVRRNPFKIAKVTARITECLDSLELNALRSIRPKS